MSDFPIKKVTLKGWRQFNGQGVDIDLDAQTTIIAGANGTGKTTVLNVVARAFGVNVLSFASGVDEAGSFSADATENPDADGDSRLQNRRVVVNNQAHNVTAEQHEVGSIEIGHSTFPLFTPPRVGAEFNLALLGQIPSVGVAYLSAHRPALRAAQVGSIPTTAPGAAELLAAYRAKALQALSDPARNSPLLEMKQTLIMLSMFGPGNAYVSPNPAMQRLYEEFSRLLLVALPPEFGFERLDIRLPHVTVVSKAGEYPIDSLSGGLSALFDTIWQLHLLNETDQSGVVLIDEPENHLHPGAQRHLLPALNRAFPRLQKVVVTHNPFILSSVRDALVYAFELGDEGVVASKVDPFDRTGSVDDVLLKTFGLNVPSAPWVEDELRQIQQDLSKMKPDDAEGMKSAIERLRKIGMLDMASRLLGPVEDAAT